MVADLSIGPTLDEWSELVWLRRAAKVVIDFARDTRRTPLAWEVVAAAGWQTLPGKGAAPRAGLEEVPAKPVPSRISAAMRSVMRAASRLQASVRTFAAAISGACSLCFFLSSSSWLVVFSSLATAGVELALAALLAEQLGIQLVERQFPVLPNDFLSFSPRGWTASCRGVPVTSSGGIEWAASLPEPSPTVARA